ncbi:hypothetical protein HPP92_017362 [Vanilla planifolia]|uniref:Uncharacterized protein n=1 Tax=Vanilla planifolia TaxID=51239 RepID=A0A835UQW3_VANPL|nr:hypothetical protein HPP92_017362 [Vanilla planifolia]
MESEHEVIEISSEEDVSEKDRAPKEAVEFSSVKRRDEDTDDDCLILDRLPENEAEGVECAELGSEAVDEMLIVGEKGQFACRDYPHPRYLCATFLFSLTPHKKHCQLCHCYVCDCPAPCINWASHCNATHKENLWRLQRQSFKKQKREKLHVDANANTSLSRSKMQIYRAATSISPPNESKPKTNDHFSIRHTQTAMASQPAPSKETIAPCSKDILCEIYKICPVVISCRRKIPPPYPLPEPPEADEGD